ncbi:MAG: putative amidohydrolase YtcJ [Psychromonas sp.]|jgi:predicted amidohydrolase YtcJ
MKNIILLIATLPLLFSCFKGQNVDLIIHNAVIYSINQDNQVFEAIAIKDGKVVELGAERQILNKYRADKTIDAQGKEVYPGLVDGHGHILSLAEQMLSVELFGCTSMDDLLVRTEKHQTKNNREYIVGRGWDQSLWGGDVLPTNEELTKLFPNTPVALYRVDGHALLANDKALELAGVTAESKYPGGIVHVANGKCTGLLVDNAMDVVNETVPRFSNEEIVETMLQIQDELLQYGITSVHEAGVNNKDLEYFKLLSQKDELKIDIYLMLMDSKENRELVTKNGHMTWGKVRIRSFKMYGDGALGSRGALLKDAYSDEHNHFGVLITPPDEMKSLAQFCLSNNYQLNTHAIGDSTNALLLSLYEIAKKETPDHRWRIEHAQIVDPSDFSKFAELGVLPSVQPTHAVSDQRWAEKRIGKERMKGAYAYNTLLQQSGMLVLGTDFPVERINPFLTIHAAVQRKNIDNFPSNGFLPKEAISLENCMRGMTLWPAIGSFAENTNGSLEPGKNADLTILEKPIRANPNFVENYAFMTIIDGMIVFGE